MIMRVFCSVKPISLMKRIICEIFNILIRVISEIRIEVCLAPLREAIGADTTKSWVSVATTGSCNTSRYR